MKFGRTLLDERIAEWASMYIDYHMLKKTIAQIKVRALEEAEKQGPNIEGGKIEVCELREAIAFWQALQLELDKAEKFYRSQLRTMIDMFYSLIFASIQQGLLDEYVPKHVGFGTRIERELARLNLQKNIHTEAPGPDLRETSSEFPPLAIITAEKKKDSPEQTEEGVNFPIIPITRIEVTNMMVDKHHRKLSKNELRDAWSEFYYGLHLLERFGHLNMEAVRKIIKKYVKNLGEAPQHKFIQEKAQSSCMNNEASLKLLISETELVFARCFTDGHRTAAMKLIRVPPSPKSVSGSNFRLGTFLGFTLALIVFIFYTYSVNPESIFPQFSAVIIVYRMVAILAFVIWAWGVDMYIWTRYHVNYPFIFEFNLRKHIRYQHMFEAASIFSLVWAITFFLYIISATESQGLVWLHNGIPWQVWPLLEVGLTVLTFIYFESRSDWWLSKTFHHILLTPFFSVRFRDFFIGDQLVSYVIVLQDIEYTLCFFCYDAWTGTGHCSAANSYMKPIIGCVPMIIRIAQCCRRYYDSRDRVHVINSGKYSVATLVVIFSGLNGAYGGAFLYIWLIFVACSTMYSYTWDIKMDWGLHPVRLRPQLLYPKPFYYVAVCTNLVLRLAWTLTISPESVGIVMNPLYFQIILGVVEIARRAQWNVYRVESEQVLNIGKYRVMHEMPMPYIEVSKLPRKSAVLARRHSEPNLLSAASHKTEVDPVTREDVVVKVEGTAPFDSPAPSSSSSHSGATTSLFWKKEDSPAEKRPNTPLDDPEKDMPIEIVGKPKEQ